MPVRLALLTPFALPSARGNAVTVDRIARGLAARGVEVRVWDLSAVPAEVVEAEVETHQPSVVHAFHAFRTGPLALRLARRLEAALVVTLTGTDANHDLFDPDRAAVVRRVLEGADTIIAFDASIGERVAGTLPDLGRRVAVVPQGVRLAAGHRYDLDRHWMLPPGAVLFVFPAGIRPVKRPRLPLGPLSTLAAEDPRVRLLYVGPVLDPDEGRALEAALANRPFARHVGVVPHDQMASLLLRASVVLNCSVSEGGMANTVLEALSLGRPVLAADIPGNRSLIAHGVTGLLFGDEAEFLAGARALAADPALRARLGAAGRALVEGEFPPERELEGHLAIYQRVAVTAEA
jgi:glycosyltransferase involved in cell wall biosynthesis